MLLDATLQTRLARQCGLAALGYAAAANQAYFEANARALDTAAGMMGLDRATPEDVPTSWYRKPSDAAVGMMSTSLPWPMGWPMATPAWPMATFMAAVGVPLSVASPAAEAQAATADAAATARAALQGAFSSYRSDGGHAVAQIIDAPMKAMVAAGVVPFSALSFGWPGLTFAPLFFGR